MRTIALLTLCILLASCSKKTTEVVKWQHDTTTIERVVVQEIVKHDTTTITADKDGETYKVIFDTLERVKEVQVTKWRDKIVKEHGESQQVVVHDTIVVKQGNESREVTKTKQPKQSSIVWWVLVAAMVMLTGYIYIRDKCGK